MNVTNNYIASGDIYPSRFVFVATSADNTVTQASATTNILFGITTPSQRQPPTSANSDLTAAKVGQSVTVFGLGCITNIEAGTGITAGQLLTTDSAGRGVPATSGNYCGALALEAGATLAHIRVQIISPFKV